MPNLAPAPIPWTIPLLDGVVHMTSKILLARRNCRELYKKSWRIVPLSATGEYIYKLAAARKTAIGLSPRHYLYVPVRGSTDEFSYTATTYHHIAKSII